MYGGQSTYIPLKVNQAGVIPIIFASSVLFLPVLLTNILGNVAAGGAVAARTSSNNYVLDTSRTGCTCSSTACMIVGFAYFYNAIAFDPAKQADQIRKQGGFIPGIRPGPQTERYLRQDPQPHHAAGRPVHRRHRPAARRSCWRSWNVRQFPFGGTTVLIAVGVALETMKQIDSQLMLRNYEGFLK